MRPGLLPIVAWSWSLRSSASGFRLCMVRGTIRVVSRGWVLVVRPISSPIRGVMLLLIVGYTEVMVGWSSDGGVVVCEIRNHPPVVVGMLSLVLVVDAIEEFDQAVSWMHPWISSAVTQVVTKFVPHVLDRVAMLLYCRDVVDQWMEVVCVTEALTTTVRSLCRWSSLKVSPGAGMEPVEVPRSRWVRMRFRPPRHSLLSSICPRVSVSVIWRHRRLIPGFIVILVVIVGTP